jgi:hypothetical protein
MNADDIQSGSLPRAQAASLQRYDLAPARAQQLIDDIMPLNYAVLDLSRGLRFEDEPSSFLVLLQQEQRRAARRCE